MNYRFYGVALFGAYVPGTAGRSLALQKAVAHQCGKMFLYGIYIGAGRFGYLS